MMRSAVQVFLSHSHADKLLADEVRESLQRRGVRVWSEEPSRPGESVAELIASGLNSADAVVVLLGEKTASRPWSSLEIGGAMASGKPIVPVLIAEDADIPVLLRDRQYLDLSDPSSRGEKLGLLYESLQRAPIASDAGETRIRLVGDASEALRREAEAHLRAAKQREREAARLQLIAMVLSVVAAAVALLVASSDASAIVAALAAGIGALLASAFGFYLGSSRGSVDRSSEKVEHQP
jgi:nucleoside 2-deoxyribosyltransferase